MSGAGWLVSDKIDEAGRRGRGLRERTPRPVTPRRPESSWSGATQYQDRFYHAAEQRVLSKDISELCGHISAFRHSACFWRMELVEVGSSLISA